MESVESEGHSRSVMCLGKGKKVSEWPKPHAWPGFSGSEHPSLAARWVRSKVSFSWHDSLGPPGPGPPSYLSLHLLPFPPCPVGSWGHGARAPATHPCQSPSPVSLWLTPCRSRPWTFDHHFSSACHAPFSLLCHCPPTTQLGISGPRCPTQVGYPSAPILPWARLSWPFKHYCEISLHAHLLHWAVQVMNKDLLNKVYVETPRIL